MLTVSRIAQKPIPRATTDLSDALPGVCCLDSGEYIDNSESEWEAHDPRDGVHVFRVDRLGQTNDNPDGFHDSLFGHKLWSPRHGYERDAAGGKWHVSQNHLAFDGWHPGRIDARGGINNIMMYADLPHIFYRP